MTEDRIAAARSDDQEFNRLVEDYRRFIFACAYKALNRYITTDDDEWSIALIAFHEAVKSYDEDKGEFRTFAGVVIRRRLLDYVRSQRKYKHETPVESMDGNIEDDEDADPTELEVLRRTAEETGNIPGQNAVKDEIDAIQGVIQKYGFSFSELAEASPKSIKTKQICRIAVRCILQNEDIYEQMHSSCRLPVKEIQKHAKISRKFIDKFRRYIVAVSEILHGDYPQLAEYLRFITEEKEDMLNFRKGGENL